MLYTFNRALTVLNVALLVIFAVWLLFGCSPRARSAADAEACRLAADETLRVRAISICPPGDLETCPEYDTLMAAYHHDQEACRQ